MTLLFISKITFRGGYLDYYPDSGLVILYDSAYVKTSEGVELWADTVKYWRYGDIVEASGGFVLKTPETRITGWYLKYNLKRHTGIATKSRTYVEKGWIVGDTVYKVSENSVYVEDGYFTTCEREKPHYRFSSKTMRVLKGDLAVVRPVVLYIRDLPVLYAPFWFMPVGKERSSGFLPPSVGSSSRDGLYIRNLSFYLVVNNYQDITVFADVIQKRGVRFGADYRYNVYKLLNGGFSGTYAYDILEGGNVRRWSLKGDHSQRLLGFDLNAHADFVSDSRYFQDYAEIPDKWVQSELVSYLTLRRTFRYGLFALNLYNRYDPLRGTTRRTLPQFSFSATPLNLIGLSLSNSFSFRRDVVDSASTSKEMRDFTTSHTISTAYNLSYFSLSPSLSLNLAGRDTGGLDVGRRYGLTLPLSTTLYGISLFGIGPAERFRHVMRPSVAYFYENSEGGPFGRYAERKGISLSLDNTHEVKIRRDTLREVKTLLQWSASTSYTFGDTLELPERFSPVRLSARTQPVQWFSVVATSEYDHVKGEMRNVQVMLNFGRFNITRILTGRKDTTHQTDTLQDTVTSEEELLERNLPKPQPWTLALSYSYTYTSAGQPVYSTLRFGISGSPTPNWYLNYYATYDLSGRRFMDQSLSVARDLHCWKLEARWSWFGGFSTYDVKVYVKAIPDIALKRGVLDVFLPR